MFASKFLLNRQKVFNPWEIHLKLKDYLPRQSNKTGLDYFYRLEWYKIGVVVPLIMYSKIAPETKVVEECQIYETKPIENLNIKKGRSINFSLFASPDIKKEWDAHDDEKLIFDWFADKISDAGKVENLKLGPNNTVYYEKKNKKLSFPTVTISGSIIVKSSEELDKIRCRSLGKGTELGCGLLLLEEQQ